MIQIPGAFNYSAICNRAAKATDGPFLVFLNNDVEILEPGWIARLIAFAARPDVGAVGAKLLYPDGTVQHAGVVLGVRGVAVFQGHRGQGTTVSAHRRAQLKTQLCEPFGAETGQNIGGEQSL